VDPRSGLRCRLQVKRAGRTFCSCAHAIAARPKGTWTTAPGARARHRAAQEATRQRFAAALQLLADDHDHVPLLTVLQMLLDAQDDGYASGYHAGLVTGRKQTRMLRLTASKSALDVFLGSRFGKSFIAGDLRPDDLANFSFRGKR
jgi:hypothetical protein